MPWHLWSIGKKESTAPGRQHICCAPPTSRTISVRRSSSTALTQSSSNEPSVSCCGSSPASSCPTFKNLAFCAAAASPLANAFTTTTCCLARRWSEAYLLEQTASSPRIALSADVAKLAVGDVVPLLAAEPLLSRDGKPVGTAQAIDFMSAELPPAGPARPIYLAGLANAIAKGIDEAADGGGDVLSKWKWIQSRFAALKQFQSSNIEIENNRADLVIERPVDP